jgi:hypothetical protein
MFSNGYGVFLLRGTRWIFNYTWNKFGCHSSGNWIQTPACDRADPILISDQWHLWWTKWQWDRVFSEYFCSPLSISFHRRFVYMLHLPQSQTEQAHKPSRKQTLSWIRGSLAITAIFHSLQRVGKGKCKALPLHARSGPGGSRKLRFPDFMTAEQDGSKFVSLTHRPPLPSGNTPGTHFCYRLSRPQCHSAAGRIMSLKNYNDTIGNRTRALPVCSKGRQKYKIN